MAITTIQRELIIINDFPVELFSGDGSTLSFTLVNTLATDVSLEVVISGVVQDPLSTYDVTGSNLVFSVAPPTGTDNIVVRFLGVPAELAGTFSTFNSNGISDNATSSVLTINSSNILSISNINYPSSDGTSGQVITTDGSGGLTFTSSGGGVTDHTLLTNIGTNSHSAIDTHIGTAGIHFTEASINHLNISNIGTNTHANIDSHIGTTGTHFTEASIDHVNILNKGTNTHATIDSHIASTSDPHNVTPAQVQNTTAQWNANQLQGRTVSSTAPSSGQTLSWNGSSWAPTTPSTGGGTHYGGRVTSTGSAVTLPSGWTSSQNFTGNYNVVHNLGTSAYGASITSTDPNNIVVVEFHSNNAISYQVYNVAPGIAVNSGTSFTLVVN